MEDRRKQKRQSIAAHLNVFVENLEHPVGQLLNITPQGLMIRSYRPFQAKNIFTLSLIIPGKLFRKKHIKLAARSVWCKREENYETYQAGFQLHGLTADDFEQISNLINRICRF